MSQSDWNENDSLPPSAKDQSALETGRLMEKWLMETLKEQRRARRWQLFFRFTRFAIVLVVLGLAWRAMETNIDMPSGEHVAIVDVKGAIGDEQEASADLIIHALRDAFADGDTKAVILNINSPGGSPVHSGEVYDEIMRLRQLHQNTPVYAVIRDIGASGAYYIAAAANEIYANRASLVGSIGVVSSGFGFTDLIDKLGVERRLFTSGENKAFLDPFTKMSPQQAEFWRSVLGQTHQQFIDAVKKGRGDRLSDQPELFSGLVWNGEQALSLGLVDGLASVREVAKNKVGVERLVNFTPELSPLKQIGREFGVQLQLLLERQSIY
ncbi:protease-4 [Oceanospirillum multiglobuliferum]|uniref:S49 family peptidase n=1 Tax=Oceanospirillum multiglobuliferum TaxID=64969 RepID=A0A1T4R4C4_9GAMM|nr:signal peptide peptidase SppA [Oceanospirillum multiglobuliferum]OPX55264.1 S49 family peptidase [Oceanospirillum multiglobuliferum]SKA10518.1 protease-4 [Oceanospirillum multiglobuliferum]